MVLKTESFFIDIFSVLKIVVSDSFLITRIFSKTIPCQWNTSFYLEYCGSFLKELPNGFCVFLTLGVLRTGTRDVDHRGSDRESVKKIEAEECRWWSTPISCGCIPNKRRQEGFREREWERWKGNRTERIAWKGEGVHMDDHPRNALNLVEIHDTTI
jgi:hypothetical protein